MLVPLDGSELAESVIVYAKELTAKLGLELTLLHVCSPEERELIPMFRGYVEQAAETLGHQSKELSEPGGIDAGRNGAIAHGAVVVGHPADEIARYADDNDVDLIMMATHGRSGIGRWAMGSVADKVLHASTVPVWLVRAGVADRVAYDKWPKKTILVPLDGSEVAESVLPHVEALAKQRDSESIDVVVFRICEYAVVPDDPGGEPSGWEIGLRREISQAKRAAEKYLARVEERLTAASIGARSDVLVGQPADVIVDYANGHQFGLVAMATHGRSGLSRLAFGSVAEKTLRGLSCPLFLARPN